MRPGFRSGRMRAPLLFLSLLLGFGLALAGCVDQQGGSYGQNDGPSGGNGNDGDEVDDPPGESGGASPEAVEDAVGDEPSEQNV